jgi:hypothetical protein
MVFAAGVNRIAARAAGKGSTCAAAVMLRPVRRCFEVGLWGSLRDPSTTLSKDLFFPAIEGETERLGTRLAAKEGEAVDEGDRVTPGDSAREVAGEGAQETAGEGAREAAGE